MKAIRLGFSKEELIDIYASLGSSVWMLTEGAARNDQQPREIANQVARVRALRDKVYDELHADRSSHDSD